MNHDRTTTPTPDRVLATPFSRRQAFRLGGLSVATAAVVAACGGAESPGIARVGLAPTTTDLPPATINDAVLLRTAASVERTAITIYEALLGSGGKPAEFVTAAERFLADHELHAQEFDALTTEVGGEPFGCGNPRLEEVTVPAILAAIEGDDAAGIPPTDDSTRDAMNVLYAYESYLAETFQSFVPMLSTPALRLEMIRIGADAARHSSILALALTGRPAGYVEVTAPETPPPIPVAYALPSVFGTVGGRTLVIGAADEVGLRRTFSLATPSLNTFVYDHTEASC